jgi:CDGSH-type Zn-finger protein
MEDGGEIPHGETYALCRCGASRKHSFCDGSHTEVGFDGTETASRKTYMERAELIKGKKRRPAR